MHRADAGNREAVELASRVLALCKRQLHHIQLQAERRQRKHQRQPEHAGLCKWDHECQHQIRRQHNGEDQKRLGFSFVLFHACSSNS